MSQRRVAGPSYWVQVGAFKTEEALVQLVQRLRAESTSRAVVTRGGGRDASALTRVRVGPFPNRAAASAELRALTARGYPAFIAESRD